MTAIPETLHVEFQEGWAGDLVSVLVDGRVCYEGRPSTRLQTGFAAGTEVQVDAGGGSVAIEVRLPGHGIVEHHEVVPVAEMWVGLSLRDASVQVRVQPVPFGYV